jgi:hypothetical protein
MGTKNYNNYSDMITFSRASSGTALAKISYGPELVTNGTFATNDLTGWTDESTGSGAPDASTGAAVLERIDSSNISIITQTITTVVGATYSISGIVSGGPMYINVGTTSKGTQLLGTNTSSDFIYNFVATTTTTYITHYAAGNGISPSIDNVSVREVFYDQPDGTSQLFDYPANQPRVEYDAQGNRLGLLVEEARTNYNTYSRITSSGWVTVRSSLDTSESALFLDGVTAPRLKEDTTASNTHHIQDVHTLGSSSAVAVFSVFVKKPDLNFRDYVALRLIDDPAGTPITYTVMFDASDGSFQDDGSAGSPTSTFYGSQQYPDGWVRIWLGFTKGGVATRTDGQIALSTVSTVDATGTLPIFNGDGVSGLYVCGAQMEQGTFPTSYIPTSGATATRSADVASIGVGAFGYNKTAGSFIVQFKTVDESYHAINFNTDSNNRVVIYGSGSPSSVYAYDRNAGGVSSNVVISSAATDFIKAAIAIKNNSSAAADGITYSMNATSWPPVTEVDIGMTETSSLQLNGHISSIAYYPRRLTDAQIQKLTQIKAVPTLSLTFDGNSDSYLETSIHG